MTLKTGIGSLGELSAFTFRASTSALIVLGIALCSLCTAQEHPEPAAHNSRQNNALNADSARPCIAFSFDDGSTASFPGWTSQRWNDSLIRTLASYSLKVMLCVKGVQLDSPRGREIMQQWSDNGHVLANHTYYHSNYGSSRIRLDSFVHELVLNERLLSAYPSFRQTPHFIRFPYLKEGSGRAKVDSLRAYLKDHEYRNAHVSIDASDWYVSSRLEKALRQDSLLNLQGFRSYYINHLFERACFYDSVATQLSGRKIKHVILLHHNLAAALFLQDLLEHFVQKGWRLCNIDEAYTDPFYLQESPTLPAGESLVWSLAKARGSFESVLRYPAEDGDYEKPSMDALGLP